MRPCCRIDSASSSSFDGSKVCRGLVADSWMVSIARNWKLLLSCMMPSLGVVGGCGGGAHTLPCIRSVGGELELSVLVSLPREGLNKALLPQVFVPQRGESLVFGVKLDMADVLAFADEP